MRLDLVGRQQPRADLADADPFADGRGRTRSLSPVSSNTCSMPSPSNARRFPWRSSRACPSLRMAPATAPFAATSTTVFAGFLQPRDSSFSFPLDPRLLRCWKAGGLPIHDARPLHSAIFPGRAQLRNAPLAPARCRGASLRRQ